MRYLGTYVNFMNLPKEAQEGDWIYFMPDAQVLEVYDYKNGEWKFSKGMDLYNAVVHAQNELESYIRKVDEGYPQYKMNVLFWEIAAMAINKIYKDATIDEEKDLCL